MSTPPHRAVASLAALLQRVEDLPKKVRHGGCMVPLTPVAFQPGELVHTNEFFVTEICPLQELFPILSFSVKKN